MEVNVKICFFVELNVKICTMRKKKESCYEIRIAHCEKEIYDTIVLMAKTNKRTIGKQTEFILKKILTYEKE